MNIRAVHTKDLAELLELCEEHARYERSSFERNGQVERWRRDLAEGRLAIWVAVVGAKLVGFASVSREYSTWRAESYIHLDCLYLRPAARGLGLGSALLDRVQQYARQVGCLEIQWQTPPWNEKAIGFYDARGASSQLKMRFSLPS